MITSVAWAQEKLPSLDNTSAAVTTVKFKKGLVCFEAKDYKCALKVFKPLADQGVAEAQFHIGQMYLYAHELDQSDSEAVKWFRLSADQGLFTSQHDLGWMYFNGRGVEQNDSEAFKWFSLAADQGYANSQYYLGWMYLHGRGVEQNDSEAIKWYRLASDQGNATSQYDLGWMYFNGRGVEQSDKEAVKWYRQAANQGYANAQNNLGWMYLYGRGVEQNDSEAIKLYRLAADQGNADAQSNLRLLYESAEVEKRTRTQSNQTDNDSLSIAEPNKIQLYWALATRREGIGYATDIGDTAEQAMDNAVMRCNESEHNSVNLPVTTSCIKVGASHMSTENCMAIVNGFVPATSFTVHIGKSFGEPNPKSAALGAAFRSCRSHWGSYGKTACRDRNGGAGLTTKTSYVFCSSDAVRQYAPHLPEPKIKSQFHNSDGKLIKEDDYVNQSPLAKEIRKINKMSHLNATERMKLIQRARRRYQ